MVDEGLDFGVPLGASKHLRENLLHESISRSAVEVLVKEQDGAGSLAKEKRGKLDVSVNFSLK